jgi:hypothetical protein
MPASEVMSDVLRCEAVGGDAGALARRHRETCEGGFVEPVKDTYRVLLRAEGFYACFMDKETERFVRSRMD